MLGFFGLLVDFFAGLIGLLDSVLLFSFVSIWDLVVGFLICGLITVIFWKGART